ncbi:hypothetical protein [[Bacillus] enclensis]|uniref:hypothetical protein n=1 Tax=[Bacillus] enclensis TaxID=1402860 RepID=UPI0018DD9F28|nr:hypothetical protein [[Bacillus] enclensis]MBH9965580.1 hypothetical protein [[Bacillus] enclensis]
MRKIKGLEIIGKTSLLLDDMTKNFSAENADRYVAKMKSLHADLKKFNRKNKDKRFEPAFEGMELAVAKFIVFLEGKGDPEVFAEANNTLKKAIELLPGGDS